MGVYLGKTPVGVVVKVPNPVLTAETFTENGVYLAKDFGVSGFDEVVVNVGSSGVVTDDATATAEDILDGKTAYVASGKVTGTYKDMLQARLDSNNNGRYFFYGYEGENLEFAKNLDTSAMTQAPNMFGQCTYLKSVEFVIDMNKCGGASNMFNGCPAIETVRFANIKISLRLSNGTTYGNNFTTESLLSAIYETWRNSGTSSKILYIGEQNRLKLENVYVKLINITNEMVAADPYIRNKSPFVVCSESDEGAMRVEEYLTTVKNWEFG